MVLITVFILLTSISKTRKCYIYLHQVRLSLPLQETVEYLESFFIAWFKVSAFVFGRAMHCAMQIHSKTKAQHGIFKMHQLRMTNSSGQIRWKKGAYTKFYNAISEEQVHKVQAEGILSSNLYRVMAWDSCFMCNFYLTGSQAWNGNGCRKVKTALLCASNSLLKYYVIFNFQVIFQVILIRYCFNLMCINLISDINISAFNLFRYSTLLPGVI